MSHYDNEREAELNKEEWPRLMNGDCLERMKEIPDGSVDMILTDPPYGTTACKWDSIIPLEPMWEQLKRIIKPNGAIVLFGSEPFSSFLRVSNLEYYKYDWVWERNNVTGQFQAKNKPMNKHELISVFTLASMAPNFGMKPKYYPVGLVKCNKSERQTNPESLGERKKANYITMMTGNPKSILSFKNERGLHPTQKPVALMEYLIKTYTNENETVLDFTMGSGSTGVAAKNLNRNFIGIEQDPNYFKIATDRISKEEKQLKIL